MLLILLSLIFVFLYFIFFVYPKKDELSWVSDWYLECSITSTKESVDKVHSDISDVLNRNYSTKILEKYRDLSCDSNNSYECKDSPLYISRFFMARGNKKDFELSFYMLNEYKEKNTPNIYYDTTWLDIKLYHAWKNKLDKGHYKNLIESAKENSLAEGYFDPPHTQSFCNLYVDDLREAYRRSGSFSSEVYIYTNILTN